MWYYIRRKWNWLTCRKGSLIPATSCSGEYPEMTKPFMMWTRSGTVCDTHSTNILLYTCRELRNWIHQIMKPLSAHCTFLKCSSVSGFRSQSSVMSTTAPCNTPTNKWEENMKSTGIGLLFSRQYYTSTNRGSSQWEENEKQGQKAPRDHGLFSQYEQHTEQPGRTVEEIISIIMSWQQSLVSFTAHKGHKNRFKWTLI